MNTNNVAGLQQLDAEEIEVVSGAGWTNQGCSPTFTCAQTTCSETVAENEER